MIEKPNSSQHRFAQSISVLATILVFSSAGHPQRGGGQRGAGQQETASATANLPFSPRDLSGIWLGRNRVLAMSEESPPRTPWGEAKFNSYKPSYGPRAIPPALGNDPQGNCDPLGIPRLLMFESNPWDFEIIQMPDRMLQVFDRHHVYRQIWMDGRELPKEPDSRWLGYSVGKWDGDTLVVNSVGFDERSWLDHFGNPHSEQMRLEERYRRVNHDTIELVMTVTDPMAYTKPWVSDKKTLTWQNIKEFPDELFCVPSEEQAFNKRVRDPAGGVINK
ncbi:MAG TPA: hypothetical protein VE422_49530 [Terriglobia bacterium]|nr:hypothetical protein [Terriglobia bacterium]